MSLLREGLEVLRPTTQWGEVQAKVFLARLVRDRSTSSRRRRTTWAHQECVNQEGSSACVWLLSNRCVRSTPVIDRAEIDGLLILDRVIVEMSASSRLSPDPCDRHVETLALSTVTGLIPTFKGCAPSSWRVGCFQHRR